MNVEYVIVADWGSSHLRAYLCQLNQQGTLTVIKSAKGTGVTKIEEQFEQHLMQVIAPWRKEFGQMPILLSGQVGSTLGWKEAPYLPCPVSLDRLATSCLTFICRGHPIYIVPGLSCEIPDKHSDVMRGEELQVLGLLLKHEKYQQGRQLICLPGTHTKWVLVDNGEIQFFKTAMTGELYDLLTSKSVLIQKKTNIFDADAFKLGVDKANSSSVGSFSHNIFSVRTKQLFGELNQGNACSYLSGLLIGSDVHAAIATEQWNISDITEVVIVGDEHLSTCFAMALESQGVQTRVVDEAEVAIAGYSGICNSLFLKDLTQTAI
ncbi:2-dehydro-3-deoxygalactonokinase [Thalassotalea nanhaiensis]|uniref:2-dehydro-3-deoxygalactonokinase n=1 Tax=Thalassotalea nanhaiensis TaxID=3065648 RepID=A0ABY9TKJ8_9GAMM|nr:2-dehydro-3-deoxygalactonokinase [Colwelliaceae bacterium SQ345]